MEYWSIYFGLLLIGGYIVGSIPFSLIIGRVTRDIDIRLVGSGNVGATNVLRTCGILPGIIALFLDSAKGFIPVFMAGRLTRGQLTPTIVDLIMVGAAAGALSGHVWPVFMQFKGGKGVAVSFGAFLALAPFPTLLSLLIFILVVVITRYVSIGSMLAAISFPIFSYILKMSNIVIVLSILGAFIIIIRHRPNIAKLLSGKESRVSGK